VKQSAALLVALFLCVMPTSHAATATVTMTIAPVNEAAKTAMAGRMLIFLQPAHGKTPPSKLDPGFVANGFTLVGFDVAQPAGTAVHVPVGADAYPKALSELPAGVYDAQPLLDANRMYSYDDVTDGDLTGRVQRVRIIPGAHIVLTLDNRVTDPPPKSTADVKIFDMVSTSLSQFYGRPTRLRASVVLPIGYDWRKRYPVVYAQTGFGGNYRSGFRFEHLRSMMAQDGLQAIFVVTDSSGPTGITEFADSATNGPWGQAFTHEFIPALEGRFPIDARPSRRFLWGHSSGGWASLWLQTTYPNLFGGTWSSSPDPVDFHDFTGPDLLASPPDNAYFDRYGRPWQLVREGTKNLMTLRDFVRSSDVEGYAESQFGSFDAVFGPRGADGKPVPLFDHRSGAVNPAVATYWEAHYDIAANIERNYVALAPSLQHKLHIAVGTLDTFHLERGVLRLDARLRRLGMNPDITYFPGASHSSIFKKAAGYEGFHWAFRGIAAAAKR